MTVFFIATNRNIYKLNKQTGEVIYSIDMKSDLAHDGTQAKEKWFGYQSSVVASTRMPMNNRQ